MVEGGRLTWRLATVNPLAHAADGWHQLFHIIVLLIKPVKRKMLVDVHSAFAFAGQRD